MEFANLGGGGACFVEGFDGLGEVVGVYDEDHSDSHVEGAAHFGFGDITEGLNGLKYGEGCPGAAVDFGLDIEGKDAGEVIVEAAAGDVGDGFDRTGLEKRVDAVVVAGVGAEEGFAEGGFWFTGDGVFGCESGIVEEDFSGEGITVCMESI